MGPESGDKSFEINSVRLILWPILVNVPCTHEMNLSAVTEYMLIGSSLLHNVQITCMREKYVCVICTYTELFSAPDCGFVYFPS